jgi:CheY-like chemotaxis protein
MNAMSANQKYRFTGQAQRALLIDDDKFMQTVIGDLLRDLGVAQVTVAASGSAGIEALARAAMPPDLILCDLHMPGGDGFEFMEKLAAMHFGGGVILVSGLDERTRKSAALMARFHRLNILATLGKPVDAAGLSAALAKLH